MVRPYQSVWAVSVPGRSLGWQEASASHQFMSYQGNWSVGFCPFRLSQGRGVFHRKVEEDAVGRGKTNIQHRLTGRKGEASRRQSPPGKPSLPHRPQHGVGGAVPGKLVGRRDAGVVAS